MVSDVPEHDTQDTGKHLVPMLSPAFLRRISAMNRSLPFHYGWLIVFAGSLGIFACIGLARFALGMLLPAMGEDLQLTYAQMGAISTANFCGYLFGILVTPCLARRYGARLLIGLALLLSGLAMIGIGLSSKLFAIILLYTSTGIGSALANIPIMVLLSFWFAGNLRGRAAGLVVSGNGAAIVFAGQAVPWLNGLTDFNWRLSWFVLGLLVLLAAMICLLMLRNRPQDLGLQPVGWQPNVAVAPTAHRPSHGTNISTRLILHCGAIYFIFGCTFVTYATFIVTTMVHQYGLSHQISGFFWSWIGIISLFSGPIFGALGDRIGRQYTLAVVFTIQALAYLLVGLHLSDIFLYLSMGCFGLVAWSVPSIMAALSGDYAGPQKAFTLFSTITFLFAIGQAIGPLLAGSIAGWTGTFTFSYLLCAFLTCLAILLSLALPHSSIKASLNP